MRIKRRKKGVALMCSCCDLPAGTITDGRFLWQSRHGHSAHTNALTAKELREIADRLDEAEKAPDCSEPLTVEVIQ